MTTRVTITSAPTSNTAQVAVVTASDGEHVLKPGESHEVNLHTGSEVTITERQATG